MIHRLFFVFLLLLRVACWLRGGHEYDERLRRVVRDDGGVELREYDTCTRCPTGDVRRRKTQ